MTLPKRDFESLDQLGNNCLWYAVSGLHLETIEILIYDVGMDPDIGCELGNTVLHKALMIDSVVSSTFKVKMDKILSVLLERCNIRKTNKQG